VHFASKAEGDIRGFKSFCYYSNIRTCMDCYDAVNEIFEEASGIKLPGHRINVVAAARRAFAKRGCCDAKFIDPIEKTMKECLKRWTVKQKWAIWTSTESGAGDTGFDDCDPGSLDLDLEGELMYLIIEELSPPHRRYDSDDSDEW
jgi:hypothetical protein